MAAATGNGLLPEPGYPGQSRGFYLGAQGPSPGHHKPFPSSSMALDWTGMSALLVWQVHLADFGWDLAASGLGLPPGCGGPEAEAEGQAEPVASCHLLSR